MSLIQRRHLIAAAAAAPWALTLRAQTASDAWTKIEAVAKMIEKTGKDIRLEVDGGITVETAPLAISAGADTLVAGTATFKGGPTAYAANIAALRG